MTERDLITYWPRRNRQAQQAGSFGAVAGLDQGQEPGAGLPAFTRSHLSLVQVVRMIFHTAR